jgi:hypothetical protein
LICSLRRSVDAAQAALGQVVLEPGAALRHRDEAILGPDGRMLRNFIRDRGTQLTLGMFVATFAYAVLVLASIGIGLRGEFVPHISVLMTGMR